MTLIAWGAGRGEGGQGQEIVFYFFYFYFGGGAVVCGVSTSLKEYLAFKIIIIYNIKNHLLVSYLSEAKGKNYPPGMSSLIPRD